MSAFSRNKYVFGAVGLLVFNCLVFTSGAMAAFGAGEDGVDNQAALILIPVFFVPAAWLVSAAVALAIVILGAAAGRKAKICPAEIFRMSGIGLFAKIFRMGYLLFCAALMLFGYLLLTPYHLRAALYAFSGGLLLVMLYSLIKAAADGRRKG